MTGKVEETSSVSSYRLRFHFLGSQSHFPTITATSHPAITRNICGRLELCFARWQILDSRKHLYAHIRLLFDSYQVSANLYTFWLCTVYQACNRVSLPRTIRGSGSPAGSTDFEVHIGALTNVIKIVIAI